MNKLLKKLLFSSLLFISINANAQINLIQDGSFEDTVTNGGMQMFYGLGTLKTWHSFSNYDFSFHWDYMHTFRNIDTLSLKLPNNHYVRHMPRTGGGAVLFLNYVYQPLQQGLTRSIMHSQLSQKLITGKQYCATIYAVASFDYGVYTNGFSMYFDNGQLDTIYTIHHDSSGIYPFVHPQVTCTAVVQDTTIWLKIQGTFIANGTEKFVTLGNFLKDTDIVKQYNSWAWTGGQEFLIDDASLIPIDLHDWLHDTTIAFTGDSVYIGLDKLDYAEGKWYTYGMQLIDSGTGFMFKPEASITKFIQGVEVCGVMRYDTMTVYAYPLSSGQLTVERGQLRVYPNPASNRITIEAKANEPIKIIDMFGRAVKEFVLKADKETIVINELSTGIYFIRCRDKSVRFVKEN